MKIVITGGHHNSALVIAERLRERGHQVFWFGHKYSMLGDEHPSAEYQEVTAKGFPFVEINAGKWQTNSHFFANLLRMPKGFCQSWQALSKIKPEIIFSSGGYLALPVAFCAWVMGISVFTHEQTVVAGAANRIIGKIAQKIFLTYPSSLKYFPAEKTVVTGMPLRPEILAGGKKIFSHSRPTIYITGGKQGAHVINDAVFKILPLLLEKFNVIHQCGSTSLFNDFEKAKKLFGDQKNYLVKDYFFTDKIGPVFASADLVISRAGAHTVYELMALKKPAILIPIPWSSGNEQQKNAEMVANFGLAKILSQADLESGKLFQTIQDFIQNLENYSLQQSFSLPGNAAETIIKEIEKFAH